MGSRRTSPLLLLLVAALAAASPSPVLHAGEPSAAALRVIEERVLAPLRASTGRRLSYPGAEHLAAARRHVAAGRTDEALASLDAWLDLDYEHSNWWVNHVPIPRAVGELALLLRDDLGEARTRRVLRVLRRAWPPPRGGIGTGANLFYRVDAAVLKALLVRDADLLRRAFERAAAEIRITDGEGIQADMSFHQHGPQLYTGSYGLEYIRGAIRVAALGKGTGLALPPEKMDLLVALVLDGLQWLVQGPMIDPAAQGRNFSRKGAGRGGRRAAELARQLAALGAPRADELEAFAASLSGNRCFWRSDLMVHRRPGWYASAKMISKRTVGTESGNGEGLKQFHLADGACLVLRRGDELDGIQPVWDWRRVPGTTCAQARTRLPRVDWGRGARGSSEFVGGVSDGEDGVAAMRLDKAGVRARKAWFFFGDRIACLGAGIRADGEDPLDTSVAQVLAHGPVASGSSWVHHDGVGIVALDGTLVNRIATQRGTWRSIHRGLSDAPVEKEVFSAWIDHGPRPDGATYAYVLLPDATPETTAAFEGRPTLRILANTKPLQAVRDEVSGTTGIVFHEAGSVAGVAVDRACVLLATDAAIHLADPAWTNEPVRVTLEGQERPLVFRPHDGKTQTLIRTTSD